MQIIQLWHTEHILNVYCSIISQLSIISENCWACVLYENMNIFQCLIFMDIFVYLGYA